MNPYSRQGYKYYIPTRSSLITVTDTVNNSLIPIQFTITKIGLI